MEKQDKEILRKNRVFLLDNIVSLDRLLSELLAADMPIVNDIMMDSIQSNRTRERKIGALLDLLPRRGPTAFSTFCAALRRTDQGFIADRLEGTGEMTGVEKNMETLTVSVPPEEEDDKNDGVIHHGRLGDVGRSGAAASPVPMGGRLMPMIHNMADTRMLTVVLAVLFGACIVQFVVYSACRCEGQAEEIIVPDEEGLNNSLARDLGLHEGRIPDTYAIRKLHRERTIPPWKYELDSDGSRMPSGIKYANCSSSLCKSGHKVRPVYTPHLVARAFTNEDGMRKYSFQKQQFAVACVCARARSV
ncbi:uncharacterized protein LOC144925075 [Branchiostoma floridae x Branchiostoma belcheri]